MILNKLKQIFKRAIYSLPIEHDRKLAIYRRIANKDILRIITRKEQSEYIHQVLKSPKYKSNLYEDEKHFDIPLDKKVNIFAYYLTQFHPNEQNDKWWGKGVTEWNNVFRAVPQYQDHRQPKLPGELGAYDLRLKDNMLRQVELAKNSGIHAFAFYYYWFSGERLLEKPLNLFLDNQDIDINFIICWANESWTKRFDGTNTDILMEHKSDFDINVTFIDDVIEILQDKRYARISAAPIIQIYKPQNLDKTKELINVWREKAKSLGINKLHLMAVVFGDSMSVNWKEYGFDSQSEFQPGSLMTKGGVNKLNNALTIINKKFSGTIYDYEAVVLDAMKQEITNYPAVMPAWDNTARRDNSGLIFHGSTPDLYKCWLKDSCEKLIKNESLEHNIIFINAWNEWGEGAYLEPDKEFGYAYLNKTAEVMVSL